jgi:hypothetical protein
MITRTTIEIELGEAIAGEDQDRILMIPWTPANRTLNHIVRYLERAGYVVMKKQPALGVGDNPAGAVRGLVRTTRPIGGSSPLRVPEGWPLALKDRLE